MLATERLQPRDVSSRAAARCQHYFFYKFSEASGLLHAFWPCHVTDQLVPSGTNQRFLLGPVWRV
jgi:hypothetical protein